VGGKFLDKKKIKNCTLLSQLPLFLALMLPAGNLMPVGSLFSFRSRLVINMVVLVYPLLCT
jgi:hypothetical protein